jgi:hypothetical protein
VLPSKVIEALAGWAMPATAVVPVAAGAIADLQHLRELVIHPHQCWYRRTDILRPMPRWRERLPKTVLRPARTSLWRPCNILT